MTKDVRYYGINRHGRTLISNDPDATEAEVLKRVMDSNYFSRVPVLRVVRETRETVFDSEVEDMTAMLETTFSAPESAAQKAHAS